MKPSDVSSLAQAADIIATSLDNLLMSPNGEPANVVDAIAGLSMPLRRIARAITEEGHPGKDECGGTVGSLTEAVMGVTAGLCQIASAISDLADAVRHKS
jgi:hypothetical protein